jgi:hypothetical protein
MIKRSVKLSASYQKEGFLTSQVLHFPKLRRMEKTKEEILRTEICIHRSRHRIEVNAQNDLNDVGQLRRRSQVP